MVRTCLIRFILLALLAGTSGGCIREGEIDCITTTALIYVTVARNDIRSQQEDQRVDNTHVYIFDRDSLLQRVVTLTDQQLADRTPVEITFDNGEPPLVVVWGNLNGAQDVTEGEIGKEFSSFLIRMKQEGAYSISPDELYYGQRQLSGEQVQEVVINFWVGRVTITVRGLEDAHREADSYYFVIEGRYDGYNFNGHSLPGNALLRANAQPGEYQGEKLLVHPPVNVVAYPVISGQRQSITVKLYKQLETGDVLIGSADTDIEGERIVTHPGENTNVLLDFGGDGKMNVHLAMTPWEYVYQWAFL